MKNTFRIIVFCALLTLIHQMPAYAFGNAEHMEMHKAAAQPLSEDMTIPLHIPLFSEAFASTPVALANNHPIVLGELTAELQKNPAAKQLPSDQAAKTLSAVFKTQLDKTIAARTGGKQGAKTEIYADGRISKDGTLTINAPLFSPWFAETPVAEVNQEPVSMAEFARDLKEANAKGSENENAAADDKATLLNRLLTVRLVEQEARNIGFDRTDSIRKQVEAFAEKNLLYALLDKQLENLPLDEEEANKLYQQISLQGKFRSFRFPSQEDAVELLKAVDSGEKFDTLIEQAVKQKKAVEEEQDGFIKFKDLLPQIASNAAEMEIGTISKAYRKADGFLIFQLLDRQFVEDPAALQFARKTVWDKQVAGQAEKYINALIKEKVTYDEQAQADMSFAQMKERNPDIKLSQALEPLLKDQRALATVKGATPETLKVAEVAAKLKATFYHGTDIPLVPAEVDNKKEEILTDTLFRMAGTMVAKQQKLEQTQGYRMKVAEFERKTLFENFMQKVVVPDVKLTEDENQAYYNEHQDKYSTPAMLKVKSLPFYKEKDALNAQKKLQSGSDFKWVSANSAGLVNVENKDLLTFDNNILSLTSLPPNIQEEGKNFRTGDSIIYADPGKFYYVLYFEKVYPPEPKPYEQVRSEIMQVLFQNKVEETLAQWVTKLKDAYETKIFLGNEKG